MKKVLSVILITTILFTSVMSLAGCSSNDNSELAYGTWLQMINESFGMRSYQSDKPYFSTISVNSPFFEAAQIAAEWGVVNQGGDLNPDAAVKWRDALLTLVNAGSFTPEETPENEKLQFGIEHFDPSIRNYWLDRNIKKDEATTLLVTAQEQWANREYEVPVEEVKYADGVKDHSQGENKIDNYAYDEDSGKVTLPASESDKLDINPGDTFVLPSTSDSLGTKILKATGVSEDNGSYVIDVDSDLDLYDVAENLYVEETLHPTAENTVIRDGNGNIISAGSKTPVGMSNRVMAPEAENMDFSGKAPEAQPMDVNIDTSFDINGWKVGLKCKVDGKFDMSASLSTPNLLGEKNKKSSLKLSGEVGVNGLKVTNKIDYQWFKLKEASLRVDYETIAKGELKYSNKLVDKIVAPYNNRNGGFLSNLKNSSFKDSKDLGGKGAQTIKICSVDIYSIGVARVCLDVNVRIEVNGTLTVTFNEHGSKGLEYKNNNLRVINVTDRNVDVELKAKIEATAGIGPALYVIGLKKKILGLELRVGLGASLGFIWHLVDNEGHLIEECDASDMLPEVDEAVAGTGVETDAEVIRKLAESQGGTYTTVKSGPVACHLDPCIDGNVYFILKLGLSDESYAADLIGGKINVSWEIFGEKNAKLLHFHIEGGKFVSECTRTYVPFDGVQETTADPSSSTTAPVGGTLMEGDTIILGEQKATLKPGDNYYLIINSVPKGYTANDLICKSQDDNICTIDKNGVVVAKNVGSTMVEVSTKDGKFSAFCAITVEAAKMDDIDHLSNNNFLPDNKENIAA